MPEIVSDEYREGYAAFYNDVRVNPYNYENYKMWVDWEDGWIDAESNWIELIGEKSV